MAELFAAHRQAWRRARPLAGHVWLCGLPGSGKTTVAPLLAKMLGLPLIEIDAQIERAEGLTVAEIFARQGEGAFRLVEAEAARAASRSPRSVISMGGGAVLARAVRLTVRRTGHLLWLKAPVELCAERAATGRPLLEGDPPGKMRVLAAAREPLYARIADATVHVFAGLSPEMVAAQAALAVADLEAQRAHA
jgi:shikimate kinase